jgi:hypothetical protein
VEAVCSALRRHEEDRVEVHIDGAEEPLHLHASTVKALADGERTAAQFTFGTSLYAFSQRMAQCAGKWHVLRRIPGVEGAYECPGCGRGADLVAQLCCGRCGCTFVLSSNFGAPCVDLEEGVRTNRDQKRFFINRPWNTHPPWMTREELIKTLEDCRSFE